MLSFAPSARSLEHCRCWMRSTTRFRQAGLDQAVASRDTPPIFDWLLTAFSFQGVSDQAARSYMEKHGSASWAKMEASVQACPSCPKLQSYWNYEGCRYDKGSFTCAEPDHIDACPVPRSRLRNGRLNQTRPHSFCSSETSLRVISSDGSIPNWRRPEDPRTPIWKLRDRKP